jgi:maltose alpha-D-glucosyltransferase/alpha-amylase
LTRAIDAKASRGTGDSSPADLLSDCGTVALAIGRRLGEMHAVLAQPTTDPAFSPQIASEADAAAWAHAVEDRLSAAFAILGRQAWPRTEDQRIATELLRLREPLVECVRQLARHGQGTPIIRIHGDFHLGQVLVASGDAYIIDFEGEPARPLAERRAKTSPLRDVAGLLRSIDYAAASLLDPERGAALPLPESERESFLAEFCRTVSAAFLNGYRSIHGLGDERDARLLDLFLIEKAAYEIAYEANNRPTWIAAPLSGLFALVSRLLDHTPGVPHE